MSTEKTTTPTAEPAEISIKEAIERLQKELLISKEPGSYYYAWQSNIAMAIFDTFATKYAASNYAGSLLTNCNEAACNFLDQLIKPV